MWTHFPFSDGRLSDREKNEVWKPEFTHKIEKKAISFGFLVTYFSQPQILYLILEKFCTVA